MKQLNVFKLLTASAFVLMNYQASVVHAEDTATSQGTDATESVDVPEQPETIEVSVTSDGTSGVTSPPTSTPTPADPNATLPPAPNPTGAPPTSSPTVPTPTPAPATTEPTITEVTVSGEIDPNATGVEAFDPIEIQLEGDNLTKDHFLTSEGLRWTEHTRVELTSGTVEGNMNDSAFWGVDNPQVPLVGYTLQAGTTGRLTRVGTTQSGIELDLLWTLEGTDHAEWMANSGNAYDGTVKGFGFVGSQHIPNSNSNSIAVFYNGANTLDMKYRIVKHNTQEEVPVIVSFITTDIDGAQGVKTDLDNLVRYIPPQSNLEEQDGVVYDATARSHGADYNGMAHLPNGGYLGAGFVSNFRYTYYTPAPARESSVYPYSIGARYELFGSALQANMRVNARQYMTTEYVDTNGQTLRPSETYLIRANEHYTVPVPKMDGYLYETHTQTNQSGNVKVRVVYHPATTLKLHYQDESGNRLAPSKTYLRKTGTNFTHQPHHIDGYTIPENYATTLQEATQHTFIYRKPYRVITHYKDTQGNMLAPSQTYTQHRGDTYQQIPPYLAGYTVPNTYQTTVQSDVEYTFVYYREYEVTLNLYDSEDRRLLESLLVKVPQDHTVTYDLPTISGYAPKGRIQLTADNNDTRSVTYQRQYPVNLHFVDQDGVTLFPSETYQVNANAAMDYLAPRKIGYTRPTVYQTVVDAAKTYTFVYHKQPKVTFRYQDMQGNALQSERILLVDKGSVLKQEAPTFDGYAMPEIFKQRIEQDTQHVFVYPKLYTITLHYRDEFGKTLRPTQVFKRAEQANVTLESEWIRGYHKPSAYTTTLDRDITHTFVYPLAPQPTYHPPYTLSPIPFSPVAKKDSLSNIIAKASTRYVPFHATLAGSPRWTNIPYYPTWQAPYTPIQVGRNKVTHARLQRGIGPNMIASTRPVTTRPLPRVQQIQTAEYYALDNGGSVLRQKDTSLAHLLSIGIRLYQQIPKQAKEDTMYVLQSAKKTLSGSKMFEQNLGLTAKESLILFSYLDMEALAAIRRGEDPNKAVAYALAYPAYGQNQLQNLYSDFNYTPPFINQAVYDLLNYIHKNDYGNYKIDLPHLGTTLLSTYPSSLVKEVTKGTSSFSIVDMFAQMAGYNQYRGIVLNRDRVMTLNGYWGDVFSELFTPNKVDIATDQDARILAKNANYSDSLLVDRLRSHYLLTSLNSIRDKMYLETYNKDNEWLAHLSHWIEGGQALFTLAGLGLLAIGIKKKSTEMAADFKKEATKTGVGVAFAGSVIAHQMKPQIDFIKGVGEVAMNFIGLKKPPLSDKAKEEIYNYMQKKRQQEGQKEKIEEEIRNIGAPGKPKPMSTISKSSSSSLKGMNKLTKNKSKKLKISPLKGNFSFKASKYKRK
ncbi:MAG: MucBP domain-containing protein [Aerococcaceae bacterium]|nr:MucBP domain-containing protein [Aerococcaceae bacterium]